MIPQLEPIADILKAARKRQALSQRALAAKAGVPQSHISKIENAAVDLQTTSLIAIARALDLEVALVPRELTSAVQALQRERNPAIPDVMETARHTHGLLAVVARMKKRFGRNKSLLALERSAGKAGRLTYKPEVAQRYVTLFGKIESLLDDMEERSLAAKRISKDDQNQIASATREIDDLVRNAPLMAAQRPAYTLDEDDDA
jgi:transcriptional regulator with XRE-family HTH domain